MDAQDPTAGCVPPATTTAEAPAARRLASPAPSGTAHASSAPAPTPTPPAPVRSTVTDSRGDPIDVIRAPTGGQPMGIAIDGTDTWGRVFVADRSSDRLSVIFGRSPELTIDCQLRVGAGPYGVAVDATSGHVLVTLRGEQRVAVVDGRADDASVLGHVELEASPAWVAIDQETRRAFVSMPDPGQVTVLEPTDAPPFYERVATFDSGPYARWLAVDQDTGRLLVSNDGQPESASGDLGDGSVAVFDARADVAEPDRRAHPRQRPVGHRLRPRDRERATCSRTAPTSS